MSYVTYTTDALVCGAYDRNTADRTYRLFTREAGMLYADARSVREERSRQRYALQEFSHIKVSLVKGKAAWKIGSVEVQDNDYTRAMSREARGSVASIYKTLRRFIHGEEASPQLFDFCVATLRLVTGEVAERAFLDLCIQIKILNLLGYIDSQKIPLELGSNEAMNWHQLANPANQKNLENLISQATLNSQL